MGKGALEEIEIEEIIFWLSQMSQGGVKEGSFFSGKTEAQWWN